MRPSTTSSRSGTRRRRRKRATNCCTAIACTGARACRCARRSRRRSPRAPVSAASSASSATYFSWRFAVDFAGGELAHARASDAKVEPVISVSRGTIEIPSARPLHAIGGYRAMFDLKPPDDSIEPINIRLFLRRRGSAADGDVDVSVDAAVTAGTEGGDRRVGLKPDLQRSI